MPATLILGSDRLAFTMARLLCSAGEKVCLLGSKQKTIMKEILQSDVERDCPFQFVDDLKNQEHLLQKRLSNIQFYEKMEEIGKDLKAVVVTNENAHKLDIHSFGSVPIANFNWKNLSTSNFIDVEAYPPLEITKMAQILVQPTTDPVALSCIRALFEKAGITEITREQANTADEMLQKSMISTAFNNSEEGSLSGMNDVIFSLFPQRKPIDHTHSIMH
ncbi:unnamed protein product [Auanema sp. JU1783]|nr:unnamed protein product [Auanema sp. JU1783]